ncbi:MAG: GNAT family N-acetyltransferase [Longimicrobiales bacterium]
MTGRTGTQAMDGITLRNELRTGAIGRIIRLHGELYAHEYGWDWTFEAFVAQTFGRLAERRDEALDRIWLAERGGAIVGCIAILAADADVAQLRWFLVHPIARGGGLGRHLLEEALSFCRSAGYSHVFLWTMASLTAASHLYRSCGFERTHQETVERWGAMLTEERYEVDLGP